ncbi:MAG TPA: penicillin-binding protein 2, partial [Thermoanaerobaculia bacterium]|nr:penicillin-binding protein 2 [Thermoanaerobaculia bacterium]
MEIQRQFRNDLNLRVRVLSVIVSLLLGMVAGGFWWVQLVQGGHYRELAENNRLRRLTIRAPRGTIHDRDGRLLVENTPSY